MVNRGAGGKGRAASGEGEKKKEVLCDQRENDVTDLM